MDSENEELTLAIVDANDLQTHYKILKYYIQIKTQINPKKQQIYQGNVDSIENLREPHMNSRHYDILKT